MSGRFGRLPSMQALLGFEAAARLHSFSRAGEELHMTQSAVSHQSRTLEELLGQPLFRRLGRGVELTDAGIDLLETTHRTLGTLGSGLKRLDFYTKPGSVVFCCCPAWASHWNSGDSLPDCQCRDSEVSAPLNQAIPMIAARMRSDTRLLPGVQRASTALRCGHTFTAHCTTDQLGIRFGSRLTWRTNCGIISGTTTIVELIPDVMARLQLIQASKRSLLSTTSGGRGIVADYLSCQWQLEIEIRQGQVSLGNRE